MAFIKITPPVSIRKEKDVMNLDGGSTKSSCAQVLWERRDSISDKNNMVLVVFKMVLERKELRFCSNLHY
jgi:hypothetical protein